MGPSVVIARRPEGKKMINGLIGIGEGIAIRQRLHQSKDLTDNSGQPL